MTGFYDKEPDCDNDVMNDEELSELDKLTEEWDKENRGCINSLLEDVDKLTRKFVEFRMLVDECIPMYESVKCDFNKCKNIFNPEHPIHNDIIAVSEDSLNQIRKALFWLPHYIANSYYQTRNMYDSLKKSFEE